MNCAMLPLSYDLHIHSCLSPCGDEDMTPANIVGMAALKELDVIALTDHNSCKNCPAVKKLGEAMGVLVLPGMELTTEEEVHVVCLFEELSAAMEFDAYVYEHLMPVKNREEIFGRQLIMDEKERILGKPEKLLINSTDIRFDKVFDLTAGYGGIMIPAHIEKNANSLLANLGFVPPDSQFQCFELKNKERLSKVSEANPYLKDCRMITNSDAHYLQDMNEAVNFLHCREKSVKGVLEALQNVRLLK